ncbi:DUF420 domain-containing protein [Novispirillum itersonii]|uniref:Uncharacterized membrane protein YozB (DUF420 family) n=1 Tax=Novispirillum itersonii TaxID=189 RepID=A0A7W9ZCM5_NOVIT|nr:DUF420 domain-containing protein [Novispirillum itersonii]MBB6208971.1 uncharacterized membrane protein YozB (DUF420 family) [Novispirillum itersonii]
MDTAQILPHLNAALNTVATLLLVLGRLAARSGQRDRHRAIMLAALAVSAVFLASYLLYHFTAPIFVFRGQGWIRTAYYILLVGHVLLAVINVPMILLTVRHALCGQFDRHRRLAVWTWAVWLTVSVSGVIVYALLYHLYP